jgi:PAS domain S-box-containing protein
MKTARIRTKLFLMVLAVTVPALVVVGGLAYLSGKAAVTRTTFDHLTSVRASKANQIESYFRQIRAQAQTSSEDLMVIEAMREFTGAYRTLRDAPLTPDQRQTVLEYYTDVFLPRLNDHAAEPVMLETVLPEDDQEIFLQHGFIAANPHPIGQKDLLDAAAAGSLYSAVHRRYHPILREFVHRFGYHDLFLVDTEGHIVYSVSKETDFATGLLDGPYRESNLAAAFAAVRDAQASGDVRLLDFVHYRPSYDAPASFIATPIDDGPERLGVLVFQTPVEEIGRVMTGNRNWRADGLGESGETYLVGPDFRMRSDSRFILEDPAGYLAALEDAGVSAFDRTRIRHFGSSILLQEVRTGAATAALAGETATTLTTDYRGIPVLSSYAPLALQDLEWAILAEIDADEAFAPITSFTRNLALGLTAILLAVLLLLWVVSRRLVAPIVVLDTLRWDPDGNILFMNEFGQDLFGFSEQELVGRPLIGTIVPESDSSGRDLRRMVHEIASDPLKYENDETENIRNDGTLIWMAWRNRPILNEDGSLREILTIGIDITERRRIEQQIKEQKQLLENTLESLTHPFYVIDANDYSIQVANSAARRLGVSDASTCHALTHRSDTPCKSREDPCPLIEVKKTGRPVTVDHIHYDAKGTPRFVEVHGYPIFDADGRVAQMIEYSLDITERKEMELQLRNAREAAETANRAKSAFLANMSHELRTPMNAIIGYSEMLAEDAEDEGYDGMVPDLRKINAAGKHLLALINDILDLSKIEAGRVDLYLERFELHSMLEEAVATVTPLVTQNGNQLLTEFDTDLGTMRADLTKLRQSLFNLLSNAAKFTKNGTVTLIAKRQRREDADWITLSVSDTGIGIRDDKLKHVFEEFSQADESTSRDFGGTGLGLPISRKFCQMMGGDVTVTSQLGSGSTFTIELPAQVDALEVAKAVSAAERAESREVPEGVHPILVIDDDPNSRDLLQRMLESEGYAVATASSGEKGLDLARTLRPSLITLDVLMPGMDGWAVLRELKADPDLRDIPVMMVSVTSDMDMGYTLGAVEHLTKPVDRDSLRRLVRQYAAATGGGHALVVDDEENVRSLFRRTLEGDGWTVAEAANGADALDRAAEQPPRIILLDLMMPVMDGFEFLMRYRDLEGGASTPIIVITAKDLDEEDRQRLAGGVERIIEKGGLTREQLLAHVRSLVASHEAPKRKGAGSLSPAEMDSD